ncbi:hypothetical protein FQN55_003419 [Onygenales sp. PD_40]|nr:hypothetical protein FQN55_003419 [Onygenales sp. PD_40]
MEIGTLQYPLDKLCHAMGNGDLLPSALDFGANQLEEIGISTAGFGSRTVFNPVEAIVLLDVSFGESIKLAFPILSRVVTIVQ